MQGLLCGSPPPPPSNLLDIPIEDICCTFSLMLPLSLQLQGRLDFQVYLSRCLSIYHIYKH